MNRRHSSRVLSSMLLLAATASQAGPVTTVPWNGAPGAASFTFDDGCASQIANVMPALRIRNVNATFFVIGNSQFWSKKADWIAAAKVGDEIANHTVDHTNLTTISDATKINNEIALWADTLRSQDPAIEAVTMAYPNCASDSTIQAAANAQSFIARTCSSNTPYAWTTKPSNWMTMQSVYVADDATAAGAAATAIDAAKNNGWITLLYHGVSGDWNIVSTTSVLANIDKAIGNKLWVSTYQNIAAYYRAAPVMDAVTATGSSPWKMTWKSPHARMPKSVVLKVKLDAKTFGSLDSVAVSQGAGNIAPNADGSYSIDFMKLQMSVTKKTPLGVLHGGAIPASIRFAASDSKLVLSGLPTGSYRLDLRTVSGRLLSRFSLQGSGTRKELVVPNSIHGRQVVAVLASEGAKDFSVPVWIP